MKRSIYLLIAMALLLTLLPTVATAAPSLPKPPYVSVDDWTIPVDPEILPVGAWLTAWGINWRLPQAAIMELGYVNCDPICRRVVNATYPIRKGDKYPQDLDLFGKLPNKLEEGSCESWQYLRFWDEDGVLLAETESPRQPRLCID